ncbi:single-stranded DNA-binding protein [Paenibacillus sp. P22]|uniref:single-stranded DNA-binding protein n=1 Tax=Paenibacillus sp. P22 TaxID=483908 RepID=UPI0003FA6CDE|nr:single-stranded DNA-binding protein [Paenibacillus sp. P22]CDN41684.1 Single-stranded DNA-binding protein [Paenibacillus sp. P22]
MLNNCVLVGRLTKDPELSYTPTGIANAKFTLAVDRPVGKDKAKEADFIPIVVWRQQAESVANYTVKGMLVAVEGRIQTRSYEKDGRKVYVTEIIANNVRFLEHKDKNSSSSPKKDPLGDDGESVDISDYDLPF